MPNTYRYLPVNGAMFMPASMAALDRTTIHNGPSLSLQNTHIYHAFQKRRQALRARKCQKIDPNHQVVEGSSNQNVPAEPLSNLNYLLPDHPQVRTHVRSTLWLMKGSVEH